jgi:hypothetical protein
MAKYSICHIKNIGNHLYAEYKNTNKANCNFQLKLAGFAQNTKIIYLN